MDQTQEQHFIYKKDTLLAISEKQIDNIIWDIKNNKRELLLSKDFCEGIKEGIAKIKQQTENSDTGFFNNLSGYGLCALHFTIVMQAASMFGVGWIINYCLMSYTNILGRSTLESLKSASVHTDLTNAWEFNSLTDIARLAAEKISSYFLNNHGKSFPILRALSDFILAGPIQSVRHVEVTLLDNLESFYESMSIDSIKEAVDSFMVIPGKTCFTQDSMLLLIGMKIESEIIDHFKKSMSLLGQMIHHHLPQKYECNYDFGWFNMIIRTINFITEPIMIIQDGLTQQGRFHPLRDELEKNYESVTDTIKNNNEQQNLTQTKMEIVINAAKDLFSMCRLTNKARMIIKKHEATIRGQQYTICSQELAIQTLTQFYQETLCPEPNGHIPRIPAHQHRQRSLSI